MLVDLQVLGDALFVDEDGVADIEGVGPFGVGLDLADTVHTWTCGATAKSVWACGESG